MARRTLDIEDLLVTPNDPNFIDGIFNYCNRRCDCCAFTTRCRLFADENRDHALHHDDDDCARTRRTFQRTFDMVQQWCARDGVDVEELRRDSRSGEVAAAVSSQITTIRQDPLLKLGESYTFPAMKLVEALRHAERSNTWPSDAREALETIEWYGMRISTKIYRALTGLAACDDDPDGDPIQSDWNGSAKVARLEIAESRRAWETILTAGAAPPDSPMFRMITLLDEIDAAMVERFPDAMSFVRPGFDEPAAGD